MIADMRFKVSVRCLTFNHSKYILDALRGFEIQKTGFPYVAVVIDDASTDGEQEILRDYFIEGFDSIEGPHEASMFGRSRSNPDYYLAVCLLETNHYSQKISKAPYFDVFARQSDYVALCEGDDIWTNPDKLRLQVSFLDAHPDYVLCHTDFDSFPVGRLKRNVPQREDDDYLHIFLNGDYYIGTLTSLFRADAFFRRPYWNRGQGFAMGDVPLWIELMQFGKVKYLPLKTAEYRVLDESAAHSKDVEKELSFLRSGLECRMFYAEKLGIALKDQNPSFYGNALRVASNHHDKTVARRLWKEARQKKAVSVKSWIYYIAVLFPVFSSMIRFVKQTKTRLFCR